jgi:septal ring-binding cell division protein DamX
MSRAEAVELYKDKIEVSLDGRQIFYLFFGGAVIVGLVFVLGVMVGRRVEARGHVDRASVAATVDPLAALDRLEGGNGLSFQGALRGNDAPASDVEKTIAAMQDKKAEPAKVEAPKAEAPKAEAPKVEEKKTDEKKPEAKKIEAPKVEDKKVEAKVDDKKVEAKKVEAKAEDKKPDAKTDEKPRFTLQLSSFQDKTEAQNYLEAMKAAGYAAYVTEGAVDGKQYFRVRLGSYKSYDAAIDAKTEFEKSAKKIALVTKL